MEGLIGCNRFLKPVVTTSQEKAMVAGGSIKHGEECVCGDYALPLIKADHQHPFVCEMIA